ncbi:hypothetical protein [Planobispora takensis]|uniref:Secreted protein n=1 Tax=Planobispora takensis TaxID=1367882 RepID=A0A8J3WTR1_9ACTN|nr:hypothetical protein [Planobispora takensis]GII02139.1 hypothetical protein Pta02_41470 [Planobispora takensis]
MANKMVLASIGAGLAATLLSGSPALAAHGAPSQGQDSGRAQILVERAPDCVVGWVNRGTITQTGYAQNQCGYAMRLKVIWARGADGTCFWVEDQRTISSKVAKEPRRFDGVGLC